MFGPPSRRRSQTRFDRSLCKMSREQNNDIKKEAAPQLATPLFLFIIVKGITNTQRWISLKHS